MNTAPIFVAGWDGFSGKHLANFIRTHFPGAPLYGCGAADLELTADDAWQFLSDKVTADTRLIVLAGVKRQAGDVYDSFDANMRIAVSVARATEKAKPSRIIVSVQPQYMVKRPTTARSPRTLR